MVFAHQNLMSEGFVSLHKGMGSDNPSLTSPGTGESLAWQFTGLHIVHASRKAHDKEAEE